MVATSSLIPLAAALTTAFTTALAGPDTRSLLPRSGYRPVQAWHGQGTASRLKRRGGDETGSPRSTHEIEDTAQSKAPRSSAHDASSGQAEQGAASSKDRKTVSLKNMQEGSTSTSGEKEESKQGPKEVVSASKAIGALSIGHEGFPFYKAMQKLPKSQDPFRSVLRKDHPLAATVLPGQTRFVGAHEGKAAVASGLAYGHCVFVHLPGKGTVCSFVREIDDRPEAEQALKKTVKLVREHRGGSRGGRGGPLTVHAYHPQGEPGSENGRQLDAGTERLHAVLKKELKIDGAAIRVAHKPVRTDGLPEHAWNIMSDPASGRVAEARIHTGNEDDHFRAISDRANMLNTFGSRRNTREPTRVTPQTRTAINRKLKQKELSKKVDQKQEAAKRAESSKLPPYKMEQGGKDPPGESSGSR